MPLHPVGFWQGGSSTFSPTIYGREASANYVVEAYGESYNLDFGSNSDAGSSIVVYATASDIEIRVAAAANGNQIVDELWWDNATPSNSGDAGSGWVTIFQLGDRSGVTVNIYTSNETVGFGDTVTFPDIGTWTDDDKSTFFNPTNATNYGGSVETESSTGLPGTDGDQGFRTLQFTFRKTGYNDYTILFEAFAGSFCESEAL